MILLPFCYFKNQRLSQYDVLKKYVFNKICVKEIISKSNELEKLKIFLMDNTLRNKYEKLENFLPDKMLKVSGNQKKEKYIWEMLMKNRK